MVGDRLVKGWWNAAAHLGVFGTVGKGYEGVRSACPAGVGGMLPRMVRADSVDSVEVVWAVGSGLGLLMKALSRVGDMPLGARLASGHCALHALHAPHAHPLLLLQHLQLEGAQALNLHLVRRRLPVHGVLQALPCGGFPVCLAVRSLLVLAYVGRVRGGGLIVAVGQHGAVVRRVCRRLGREQGIARSNPLQRRAGRGGG
jgi:hypothetical protein